MTLEPCTWNAANPGPCNHCGNPRIRATSMTTGCCDGERRDYLKNLNPKPMNKTHTLNLNNGAIHHLAQVLGGVGFLSEHGDVYRAGEILESQLLDLPMPPERVTSDDAITAEKRVKEWQRTGNHTIELTERQRETAKKATLACVNKGGMPPGPASLRLLTELGLAPEA